MYTEIKCEVFTEEADPQDVLEWFHENGVTILALDSENLERGQIVLVGEEEGYFVTEDDDYLADIVIGKNLPWPAVIYDQAYIHDGDALYGSVLPYESPENSALVACDNYGPMIYLDELSNPDNAVQEKIAKALALSTSFDERRRLTHARTYGEPSLKI